MSQIFISYAREDIEFAGKIVDALSKNDLETWLDWKNVPKGEKVQEEIHQAIEHADIFLFLVSPDSVKSPWCREEIQHASKNKKRVIPVVIRDTKEKNVPNEIRERNWIFCRDGRDNFDKAISETFNAISSDNQWMKFHTKLLVKALDWERRKDNSRLLRGKELQEAEQQLSSAESKKDPQPTDLQREFISESRRVEKNRQKTTTRLFTGTLTIMCLLCVLAITSGGIAYIQNKSAATAQVEVTAQKNIADTRQLATIANNFLLEGDKVTLGGLLAAEAAKRYPELDSDQALRGFLYIYAVPISNIQFDETVGNVKFSPNGLWAVATSKSGIVKVWEVETGNEISRLKLGYPVYDLVFSPNEQWLLTIDCVSSEEGLYVTHCLKTIARIWSTKTWDEVANMSQGNHVITAKFSPNSNLVISSGADRTVIVWEPSTGTVITRVKHDETSSVSTVDFSPDGKFFASAGANKSIVLWDTTTGREVIKMTDRDFVDFVLFSPNGEFLLSQGHSDILGDSAAPIIWDANTGNLFVRMDYDEPVDSSIFSPDSSLVVSRDNGIWIVWSALTGEVISQIRSNFDISTVMYTADGNQIFSDRYIADTWDNKLSLEQRRMVFEGDPRGFSPDGTKVAYVEENEVRIVKFPIVQEFSHFIHEGIVEDMAFSPNNNWIVSGSQDGTTRVWDIETGQEISRMTVDGLVVSVDFSRDGKWVAQGACEGVSKGYVNCGQASVRIWETETGKQLYQLNPDFGITTIKLVPNSNMIAVAGSNMSLRIWDLDTGVATNYEVELPGPGVAGQAGTWINNIDIDSSGRWLVTHGQVWDLQSKKKVYQLIREVGGSLDFFSPSGNWIASPDGPNIRIWEPENGDELFRIPLNTLTEGVSNLSFSRDEKYLIGEGRNTIHVWEISTGREISRIATSLLYSIAISPDGKFIASATSDSTIRAWLWRPEDLIFEVCKRLPRNLTQEEWTQFIGNEPYKPTCPNLPTP